MKITLLTLLMIMLILIRPVSAQGAQPNPITVSNTTGQPIQCSKQQMEDYANNYLISLVGQDWFSKYYTFNDVFAYKPVLSAIQDPRMTANSYIVEAQYNFVYPNFGWPTTEPSVTYYANGTIVNTTESVSSSILYFKLYSDSVADCQNMPIWNGYGIVKPFTISIDSNKAISIFQSNGYNVNSVSPGQGLPYIDGSITYFKPVYTAPISSSQYGYVDVETGNFYTENAIMPAVGNPRSTPLINSNLPLFYFVISLTIVVIIVILVVRIKKK
jgi:hypothetical protein